MPKVPEGGKGSGVWGVRGLCLGAEKLKAKSLSKYDQYTLNPFPNFSVVFGEGVRRTGGATARFVSLPFCLKALKL